MPVIEEIKKFFVRKRSWRWVAAALVMAIIGQVLEGVAVLPLLRQLTASIRDSLQTVQPFEIASIYAGATRGHVGLWFCAPVGSLPDTPGYCGGAFGLANSGIASLLALPQVIAIVWERGGLLTGVTMIVTLLLILGVIIASIVALFTPGKRGEGVAGLLMGLALAPLFVGAIFWVMLQLLLLLTFVFGQVLAGAAWLIATFGALYQFAIFCLGVVQSADSLETNASLLSQKLPTTPPSPPAPPPPPR